jgi:hypothetical protein
MLEECRGPSMGSRHGANTPPESGVGGANPRVGGASYKPSCQNILNLGHPIHTAPRNRFLPQVPGAAETSAALGTIYKLYIPHIGTHSLYRYQVQEGRLQP